MSEEKFGQRYVNFPDIHFPQHNDRDGVQIREKWQFSKEWQQLQGQRNFSVV